MIRIVLCLIGVSGLLWPGFLRGPNDCSLPLRCDTSHRNAMPRNGIGMPLQPSCWMRLLLYPLEAIQ